MIAPPATASTEELQQLICATQTAAWFRSELENEAAITTILKIGNQRLLPGLDSWRSRVLMAHYEPAIVDESYLIPLFLLWARIFSEKSDLPAIPIKSLADIRPYCPSFDRRAFAGEIAHVDEWIELGQALCCAGKIQVSDILLQQFRHVVQRKKENRIRNSISFIAKFLRSSLMGSIVAVGILLPLEVAPKFISTIPALFLIDRVWRRRAPAPSAFISRLKGAKNRDDDPAWGAVSIAWQRAATILLKAGQEDLAAEGVERMSPQEFLLSIDARRWKWLADPSAHLRLLKRSLESSRDADADLWMTLASELEAMRNRETSLLPTAGLHLAEKGRLKLKSLVKLSERYAGNRPVHLRSREEAEKLITVLSANFADRDLLEDCKALLRVKEGRRYFVSSILRLALLRSKYTFAEVLHAIAQSAPRRDWRARSRMRHEYLQVLKEDLLFPSFFFELPVLFRLFRWCYLKNQALGQLANPEMATAHSLDYWKQKMGDV